MIPADEDLLARLDGEERARNGVPREEDVRPRERAAALARAALGDVLHPDGLRTSVLGPGWSSDVDAHCVSPPSPESLRRRGWLPLSRLLRRLGHDPSGQWAIVEGGEILAVVDVHTGPPPDPAAALLARCRRRGEVRAREVLELRAMVRQGSALPPDEVVRLAARIEAHLGGSQLASFRGARPPVPPPVPMHPTGVAGGIRRVRRWMWRLRHGRRRFVVAISGVDGAGKSTVAESLRRSFQRAGFPVTVVWTRPGMRLGWLRAVASSAKRLAGQPAEAGVTRVGAGGHPQDLPSRRGLLGWVWALTITISFVRDARRRARVGGIVIFDRHLPDALATLDVVYGGVRLGLHRAVVRWLLPRADAAFYLDVPVEAAVARKADEVFGEEALRRHLAAYERWVPNLAGVVRLDASRTTEDVTGSALHGILVGR